MFLIASFAFTACKGESESISDSSGEYDSYENTPCIAVLYPPHALGDGSYYDNISYAVHLSALENKAIAFDMVPEDLEDAENKLVVALTLQYSNKDVLIICADPLYLSFLEKHKQAELEAQQILLLESREVDNPYISTAILPNYGMSYLSGVAVKTLFNTLGLEKGKAICLLANDTNSQLLDGLKGFSDGFDEGWNGKIYSPEDAVFEEGEFAEYRKNAPFVAVKLVDDETEESMNNEEISLAGFDKPTAAYVLSVILQSSDNPYDFYYPLCGSSIQGLLRYSQENHDYPFLTAGVNSEVMAYSDYVVFSAIKHIDKVVKLCISQWLNDKTIPHFQEFGLKDGYTEVVVDGFLAKYITVLKEAVEEAKETAILKEREYEDKQ